MADFAHFLMISFRDMHQIYLGNNAEFVHFQIQQSFDDDGWRTGDVEVKVRGFSASITAHFQSGDFREFADDLQILYKNLAGQAKFQPLEEQLTLTLVGNGRGGIEVSGSAWFCASYGSKLEFAFDIDQTYLPAVIDQLAALNGDDGSSKNEALSS